VLYSKGAFGAPAWSPLRQIHLEGRFLLLDWLPDSLDNIYLQAYMLP
jgi:hypothetical protein